MAPEYKNSDAGDPQVPKRGFKVLILSEMVTWKKKNRMLRLLRSIVRKKFSICETLKKEKNLCIVYYWFGNICVSGIHWGFWNVSPMDKGRILYLFFQPLPQSLISLFWAPNLNGYIFRVILSKLCLFSMVVFFSDVPLTCHLYVSHYSSCNF